MLGYLLVALGVVLLWRGMNQHESTQSTKAYKIANGGPAFSKRPYLKPDTQ